MSVQPLSKLRNSNPRTVEEACALVKHVESLFNPWNVDALVAGFVPDCVVRFGDLPEFRGHDALRKFFTARSQRQKNYTLVKTLKAVMDDTICNTWEGQWEDPPQAGRWLGSVAKHGSCGMARLPCGRRHLTRPRPAHPARRKICSPDRCPKRQRFRPSSGNLRGCGRRFSLEQ